MPKFNITPVPKPRMTNADRRIPRPATAKYWTFKDDIRRQASQAGFELGQCFMAVYHIPMPKSWSRVKKERMNGKPHLPVPDSDNITKAIKDCLLPGNDSGVWFECAAKFWAYEGAIEIVNLTPSEAMYILVRKDITKGVIE